MDEFLDHLDIAQAIRQERDAFEGCFLIVEGKNDLKSLRKFFDTASCSIQPAGDRKIAALALRELEEEGFEGVLCVVDSDYGPPPTDPSENLIETGVHDLDVAIIASRALDDYLFERCEPSKLAAFEAMHSLKFRQVLFEAARPIGCLRLLAANHLRNMRLSFKDLDFKTFIDCSRLETNCLRLFQIVFSRSRSSLSYDDALARYKVVLGKSHDLNRLCQGHDLVNLLSLALSGPIATLVNPHTGRPDPRSWHSEVQIGLRLAFGVEAFQQTHLYQRLSAWEKYNHAYRILRHDVLSTKS